MLFITVAFLIFDRASYLNLAVSLLGATSLIFGAKGNPLGLILGIIFSSIYCFISFSCAYYGEVITYAGMTMPMSVISLISWLKNPYNGNKAEVKINKIGKREIGFAAILSIFVTVVFYFVLKYFGTASLVPSTISIATSFMAVYLTFRRSPYYALAYALNDVVLIVLWIMATVKDTAYVSVLACFAVFFANDIYGFINWKRMQRKQERSK